VPLKNRRGDCLGAIGMTVQLQSLATDAMVQTLLTPLREAAQAMRPIL
jgi:IclR family pca regulon transcriptional regulator